MDYCCWELELSPALDHKRDFVELLQSREESKKLHTHGCSLVDRHLGFHILHVVNDTVNNIGVHVSFPIRVFSCGVYTQE